MRISILAAILLSVPLSVHADDAKPASKDTPIRVPQTITLGTAKIDYESTAGMMPIKDEDGKLQANIFFTAYTKTGADVTQRPVMFCFNGGPGSSSVWLHMGVFGPKRVAMTDNGDPLPPPAKLIENETCLLDLTDLVFIDPVSTGFSRAAEEKNAKNYHGVQEDVTAVGEFIRLYCTKHNRWASPKYLAGESYGTTRAAALSGHLQNRLGMRLNGIVLVSAILNFETARFDDGNDLPYPLFLPSYAATAWYHSQTNGTVVDELKRTLANTLQEVETFANGEYLLALQKGLTLTDAEKNAVAEKLAKYTGVSKEFALRCDLRIDGSRFQRELLRKNGKIVGRFDSRYAAQDGNDAAERPDFDPSYAAVQGSYTEAFNTYVRGTLKYESDLPYEILTDRVKPWNYGGATNRYLNVAPTLRSAMTQNKDLRVFVANGYYDLATPYAATKYTMNHLSSDRKLLDRVTMQYYDAGHMMYLHKPSLLKLRKDLEAFLSAKP